MPPIVEPEMQKILDWLHNDLPDPSSTHNRLLEEHHEGTGEWFLHSEKFKRWEETPGGMLWIQGIRTFSCYIIDSGLKSLFTVTVWFTAGNGKSVLL
jgi:hypothetical protein